MPPAHLGNWRTSLVVSRTPWRDKRAQWTRSGWSGVRRTSLFQLQGGEDQSDVTARSRFERRRDLSGDTKDIRNIRLDVSDPAEVRSILQDVTTVDGLRAPRAYPVPYIKLMKASAAACCNDGLVVRTSLNRPLEYRLGDGFEPD